MIKKGLFCLALIAAVVAVIFWGGQLHILAIAMGLIVFLGLSSGSR